MGKRNKRILNAAEEYGLPKPRFQEFDNMFRVELFCSSFPMINEKENIGETSEKHRRWIGEQTSTIHSKRLDIQKRKSFSGVGNNFVRALATEIDNKEEYEFLKGNKELEAIFSQYLK